MEVADSTQECADYEIHNLTTDEGAAKWLYSPADISIITIIIPTILTFGIINNLTFLFVIFRVPKMRSTVNIYLVHLALADSLYLVLSSSYYFHRYVQSPILTYSVQFKTSASCVIFLTVVNTGYFTSVALITLVSLERYLALCHPIKHLNIRSKKRTIKLVAMCWMLGFVFAALITIDNAKAQVQQLVWPTGGDEDYRGLPEMVTTCTAVDPWVYYYTYPMEDIPWLIALITSSFMYGSIINKMRKQRSRYCKNWSVRNHIAKMLIVNGVIFFLCQTPHRIFNMTSWICLLADTTNPFLAFRVTTRWISYIPQIINTIVNPVVYGAMSKQYRRAFLKAFKCHKIGKRFKARHVYTINTASANTVTEQL